MRSNWVGLGSWLRLRRITRRCSVLELSEAGPLERAVLPVNEARAWSRALVSIGTSGLMVQADARIGYHPWFTHGYTLSDVPPEREEHYRSIFFKPSKAPSGRNETIFKSILPYLPDPIPFSALLDDLRRNITTSLREGRLTMLGEVGLDGGARMKWPKSARHLYEEKHPLPEVNEGEEEGEWNRLTPFKVSMDHQRAIVEAQLEVAIDLGVNISFHSVAAPGQSPSAS